MAQTIVTQSFWKRKTRQVTVLNNGDVDVPNTDETCVISALLDEDFHQTSKATGVPANATAYIHCEHSNHLYAFQRFRQGQPRGRETN